MVDDIKKKKISRRLKSIRKRLDKKKKKFVLSKDDILQGYHKK